MNQAKDKKISETNDLFINETMKGKIIALIDSSGSVTNPFGVNQGCVYNYMVFDEIKKKVMNLYDDIPSTEGIYAIFWNSDQNKADTKRFFRSGTVSTMGYIDRNAMNNMFSIVKMNIDKYCQTYPHLGFDAIDPKLLSNQQLNKIYYITDGQISPFDELKTKLKQSIKKLVESKNIEIQMNIITVENENRDFDQIEAIRNSAGGDVYNIIMTSEMTGYVTNFTSYALNYPNGYTHISRMTAPKGCIAFGDKYFSEIKVNQFMRWLRDLITSTNSSDELLRIVQNLTVTISGIIGGKSKFVANSILEKFCELFTGSCLDPSFVRLILNQTVRNETEGKANIFAEYREKLKNLYKQADSMLHDDVKNSLGITDNFISFPVNGRIIMGSSQSINRGITIKGKKYPLSSVMVDGIIVPCLPVSFNSPINDQCTRQWIRSLIGHVHNVDPLGDIALFTMLGHVLAVVLSDSSNEFDAPLYDEAKRLYVNLGLCMLRKKRFNQEITELDNIRNGNAPVSSNSNTNDFDSMMRRAMAFNGLKLEPMTFWYAICLALDQTIANRQLIHCSDAIAKDFPDIKLNPENLLRLIKTQHLLTIHLKIHRLPFECSLEYNCLITLEDVSETGGWIIDAHLSAGSFQCKPPYVFSEEAYKALLNKPVCPICYADVSNRFTRVGKKPTSQYTFFEEKSLNPFNESANAVSLNSSIQYKVANSSQSDQFSVKGSQMPSNPSNNLVIFMRGKIGCGKTTMSYELAKELKNYECVIEGVDKYAVTGMKMPKIFKNISNNLEKTKAKARSQVKPIVVIIDTCGEKIDINDIFGVNFAGWKSIVVTPNYIERYTDLYMAWSLRNVLRRTKTNHRSTYNINPINSGRDVCIDVHRKKANSMNINTTLFPSSMDLSTADVSILISHLNTRASQYEEILNKEYSIRVQMDSILEQVPQTHNKINVSSY